MGAVLQNQQWSAVWALTVCRDQQPILSGDLPPILRTQCHQTLWSPITHLRDHPDSKNVSGFPWGNVTRHLLALGKAPMTK